MNDELHIVLDDPNAAYPRRAVIKSCPRALSVDEVLQQHKERAEASLLQAEALSIKKHQQRQEREQELLDLLRSIRSALPVNDA